MKKTLLCFILLFTTFFYGQVGDLQGCRDYPIFDLTSQKTALIGNLNPNDVTVTYHLSLNDANNNLNVISTPTAFVSPNPSTIYARIDNKGTITTNQFNLTFYIPLNAIALQSAITCENSLQQNIHLIVNGGTAPYLYSLDLGKTYNLIRPFHLDPGDYTILIKDGRNCRTDTPVFLRVQPPIFLTAAATVTEGVNCGDKDSVTLTATGGQAPYSYSFKYINQFSDVNTSNSLPAGTHTLYVKDQSGCISSTTVTVNQYKSTLAPVVTMKQISCSDKGGTIVVKGIGGKAPYQYALNGLPYSSKDTFTDLVAGIYEIKTKDDLGCVTSLYGSIESYSPIIGDMEIQSATCFGSSNGSITVNASGGSFPLNYSLTSPSGLSVQKSLNNTFKDLPAGPYTVEIIDLNGCFLSLQAIINEPSVLQATILAENKIIKITATGGNGDYLYSLDGANFQSPNIFTNLEYGNYQVWVKDKNGCVSSPVPATLNPPAPLINGKNILNIEFKPGQTLADLIIEGLNIKWYSNKTAFTGKTSKTTEVDLPLTTVLVDGTTYYASQTINGIESTERLAVTAKLNGSLSSPDFILPNFKYYPNPIAHVLSISNDSNIDEIEVLSVSGKSVLAKKINNTHSDIDLSNVASGFYFLKVKSEGKTKTIKIVKK